MRPRKTHAEHLDVSLVRRLLLSQFPEWADLPIRPVEFDGRDNTTFRLGDDMSVRLPSHAAYEQQVEKEHHWLPRLAPLLPLPIPVPLVVGVPSADFPLHWSVRRWIEGEILQRAPVHDQLQFVGDLTAFVVALQRCDSNGGPPAGPHSFWRAGPLAIYDKETRDAIEALNDRIDAKSCTEVWEVALAETWTAAPVWVHGDIAPDNLLVRDGRLSAVIDFGCSAVGDPACDLVMAWTYFSGESREAFRAGIALDDPTWARGRGWALWKALIVLARTIDSDPEEATNARRVITEVLADHASIT